MSLRKMILGDSGIPSLKGSKVKPAKEIKKDWLILAMGKKAKVISVRSADIKMDLKGLKEVPVKDTVYVFDFKFTEGQLSDTNNIFQHTYRANDSITYWPEIKPQKYALKTLVSAFCVGLLTGMVCVAGAGLYVYFS